MQINLQTGGKMISPLASRYVWTAVCVVLTLLKFWLVTAQTLTPVSPSPADDDLFLSQAESMLRGEWLGKASNMVMAKGPIYPLWLYLNHLSGVPLLLAQAILYAVSCWVLVSALRPIIHSRWGSSVLYLAILFNPVSWANEPVTRLVREGIYPALTLFLIACVMGTVLRISSGVKVSVPWAMAAGFFGALFAMTREEGVWALPSVGLILLAGIVHARRAGIQAWIVPVACAGIAYGLPTLAVTTTNERHYGVFSTCETTSEYFKSAYGALTKVRVGSRHPLISGYPDAPKRISSVSPSFREEEPYLERKVAGWKEHDCKAFGICGDIVGGWFMRASRDAASNAVEYR